MLAMLAMQNMKHRLECYKRDNIRKEKRKEWLHYKKEMNLVKRWF